MRFVPFVLVLLSACDMFTSAPVRPCTQRSACCKVCDKGNACGDSCVAEGNACSKARGCACDVEEVCK
ncbi:MAG: hypothetical protein IT381_30110 [Deltaproteobacteria bacterium]|nr:hypothetical protein [Deltaproteobacteria bacterium]